MSEETLTAVEMSLIQDVQDSPDYVQLTPYDGYKIYYSPLKGKVLVLYTIEAGVINGGMFAYTTPKRELIVMKDPQKNIELDLPTLLFDGMQTLRGKETAGKRGLLVRPWDNNHSDLRLENLTKFVRSKKAKYP